MSGNCYVRFGAAVLFAVMSANASAISFTFTSISEQTLDSQTTSFVSESFTFDMTNDTGDVWNDFHLRAEGVSGEFGPYNFMRLDTYTGPGTATFLDNDGDSLSYTESLTIDDLSIADGATLSFSVFIRGGFAPEGMTSYSVYGLPSVGNGPPLPEPTTLALIALGLAGIGAARRRKKSS